MRWILPSYSILHFFLFYSKAALPARGLLSEATSSDAYECSQSTCPPTSPRYAAELEGFDEEDEEGAFMQMGQPLPAPRVNLVDPTHSSTSNVDEMTALLQRPQAATQLQQDAHPGSTIHAVRGHRVSGKKRSATPTTAIGNVAGAATPLATVSDLRSQKRVLGRVAVATRETICGNWPVISFLALGVFMFYLKQWGDQKARKGHPTAEAAEPCKSQSAAVDAFEVDSEADEVSNDVLVLSSAPMPTPRLSHVGTSFVVPVRRVMSCSSRSLSIEVPVSPAVWPLKATFSRSSPEAWSKIDLTVDIIDAAGLPPLLSCGTPDVFAAAQTDGGSGGTGAPGDEEQISTGGSGRGDRDAWLEIRSGAGVLAGCVMAKSDGGYTVQRDGHPTLDIDARLNDADYWIVVYRRGVEVAISTRLAHAKFSESSGDGIDEYIQIDTQPDTSSPESMLLLMCMLAIMVFEPSKPPKE